MGWAARLRRPVGRPGCPSRLCSCNWAMRGHVPCFSRLQQAQERWQLQLGAAELCAMTVSAAAGAQGSSTSLPRLSRASAMAGCAAL